MNARTIRRAAERKAAKQARQQANRANALLSTGPRTEAGKAISSQNALKTGLTGRAVLLPTDDAAAYQHHLSAYQRELQPEGLRERELVQQIADTQWRLQRIPALEMALYAKGRAEFLEESSDLPANDPRLDAQVYLRYEKSLRNLHLQESRLRRQREKDTAELKALQAERQAAASTTPVASFFQPPSDLPHNALRAANASDPFPTPTPTANPTALSIQSGERQRPVS